MAQAIYREWFVHFRYPGHEDARRSSNLPIGLDPRRLGTGCGIVRASRQRLDKLEKSAAHPFITMGDLSERSMDCFPSDNKTGSSGPKFQNGDTLFARITPCLENGKTGLVQCLDEGQPVEVQRSSLFSEAKLVGPAFTYFLARDERVQVACHSEHERSQRPAAGQERVLR